jgi:hypothetical protein
MGRC